MNVEAIAKKFGLKVSDQDPVIIREEIGTTQLEREREIYNRAIDDVIAKLEELKKL